MKRLVLTIAFILAASNAHAVAWTFAENTSILPNPEMGPYKTGTSCLSSTAGSVFDDRIAGQGGCVLGDYSSCGTNTDAAPQRLMYCRSNIATVGGVTAGELAALEANLQTARTKGMKYVMRFRYPNGTTDYPSNATVVTHINEFRDSKLFDRYADVIAYGEMGFIGPFGEWHYDSSADALDHCNEARASYNPGSFGCSCTNAIVPAVLDMFPPSRMVGFRYPRLRLCPGYGTPVTEANAYNGSNLARLGIYDDGMFNDKSDYGTFHCSSTSPNGEFDYWDTQGLRTFFAGEADSLSNTTYSTCSNATCSGVNWPTCTSSANCSSGGTCTNYQSCSQGLLHAAKYNTVAINDGNASPNAAASWDIFQNGGCVDDLHKGIGYRYVLTSATLPGSVAAGTTQTFSFNVRNDGFARMYNERKCYLEFDRQGGADFQRVPLDTDPRKWAPNGATTTVTQLATLEAGLAAGTYDVDLWCPDGSLMNTCSTTTTKTCVNNSDCTGGDGTCTATNYTLRYNAGDDDGDGGVNSNRPATSLFSVQFANSTGGTPGPTGHTVWNSTTARNKLGTFTVSGGCVATCATNTDCNDSNGCTTDLCSGACLICSNTNHTSSCTDGLYCNGLDNCINGNCDTHAGDPCAPLQTCNESSDACNDRPGPNTNVERWHPVTLSFTDATESYIEASNTVFRNRRMAVQYTSPPDQCTTTLDCPGGAPTSTPVACVATKCVYTDEAYWFGDGGLVYDSVNNKYTDFPEPSGRVFISKFSPPLLGSWTYNTLFCSGTDVALTTGFSCGSGSNISSRITESLTGSFEAIASTKPVTDLRSEAHGWVNNEHKENNGAGGHYFRFLGGNPRNFILNGWGGSECIFGYTGFDGTARISTNSGHYCENTGATVNVKSYSAHTADWVTGDVNWACGTSSDSSGQTQTGCVAADATNAGKNLIGGLNQLGATGINALYIMVNNSPDGDCRDTFPFLNGGTVSSDTRSRYDISKLAQWELALTHMDSLGMCPIFSLGETEMDEDMDDSATSCTGSTSTCIGEERRIYVRELQARFGHHPCIIWMVDEENAFTQPARASYIQTLKQWNTSDHPVTIHTNTNGTSIDNVYKNSSGTPSTALHHTAGSRAAWDDDLDMTGTQLGFTPNTYDAYYECHGGTSNLEGAQPRAGHRTQSANDSMRWLCGVLEPQGPRHDQPTGTGTSGMITGRKGHMWPALMSGMSTWLWYLQQSPSTTAPSTGSHSFDPCVNDFGETSIELANDWSGIANTWLNANGDDLAQLVFNNTEQYVSDGTANEVYQGVRVGELVLTYQSDTADLTVQSSALTNGETYSVEWLDPKNGDTCLCDFGACSATGLIVDSGSTLSIGDCPCCDDDQALRIAPAPPEATTTTSTTVPPTTTTMISGGGVGDTGAELHGGSKYGGAAR